MTTIRQADLIESVAAALQYISYYHPADYIRSLARAYEAEQSTAAKDAIAQILTNSKMCAEGHRPICQDTGIVNVFLKVGMDVRWEGFSGSLEDAINEGVRRGYLNPDNKLRASVVDPTGVRPQEHQGQHARGGQCPDRAGQHGRSDGGGQGRRLGEQEQVRHAQPVGLDRRLGAEDGADDGRRLVPAGHARHRHRRHGGKSDVDGQGSPDGRHRHDRADGARTQERRREAARRTL